MDDVVEADVEATKMDVKGYKLQAVLCAAAFAGVATVSRSLPSTSLVDLTLVSVYTLLLFSALLALLSLVHLETVRVRLLLVRGDFERRSKVARLAHAASLLMFASAVGFVAILFSVSG